MTEAKQFTCDICNTEKVSKNFRRFQTVCIECENNPNKILLKVCNTCNEEKEIDAFYFNRTKCKDCCKAANRVSNKLERCICCHEEKERALFRRGQHVCKDCEANPSALYDKECAECHKMKPSTRFRLNRKKCIDCEQEYGRNYGKATDTRKKWVENNRERMSELQNNYYEAHKTEIRKKESEKLQNDPNFRLCKAYRKTIGNLVRGTTQSNKRLDVTRDQYLAWMEFGFVDDMSFDNYNVVWQSDHVIPIISVKTKELGKIVFEETDDMEYVYKWYNTGPLTCKANHTKNRHIDKKLMAKHLNNLSSFLTKNQKSLGIKLDDEYTHYRTVLKFVIDNS